MPRESLPRDAAPRCPYAAEELLDEELLAVLDELVVLDDEDDEESLEPDDVEVSELLVELDDFALDDPEVLLDDELRLSLR